MLEPQVRSSLLEALRPPEGYQVDRAIGTTYSLDLLALAIAPLAFVMFDWEDDHGRIGTDGIALMEALRRYADRTSIFCQAGGISVPQRYRPLISMLENTVVEVLPPHAQGVFHPKIWVLRLIAPNSPVLYRLLCLTRNLTFDRSWDTVLCVEGKLEDRQRGIGESNPIGDFIAALPQMATRPMSDRVVSDVELVAYEVRRVRFAPPEGFQSIRFWPMGIRGYSKWPFEGRTDRMLIVSPFLCNRGVGRLASQGGGHILASRLEEIVKLSPDTRGAFSRAYALNEMASGEGVDDEALSLTGLHAKLYVADAGWNARIWTGSANATDAAFRRNVEFMVELQGKKSRFGIDALLSQSKGQTSLRDLLQEIDLAAAPEELDSGDAELQQLSMAARRILSGASLRAAVAPTGGDEYSISIICDSHSEFSLPAGTDVRCWPITVAQTAAVDIDPAAGTWATFPSISFEAITSFFALEMTVVKDDKVLTSRFVLNLPLENPPANRRERLLRSMLDNREQLLRFLLFLLAEDGFDAKELIQTAGMGGDSADQSARPVAGLPLLEMMLRALDRNPGKLDHIAGLVDDLKKTSDGAQLLPDEFGSVWEPIWSVRSGMRDGEQNG